MKVNCPELEQTGFIVPDHIKEFMKTKLRISILHWIEMHYQIH